MTTDTSMQETIVLGGGCFWCLEAAYQRVKGVTAVVSGYAGGTAETARYELVSSGTTNHAEVVQVTYDPAVIGLSDILDIFWVIHDPTTKDRQGADTGPQYRSVIFYTSPEQEYVAKTSIERIQQTLGAPVVTELAPLTAFYAAESYHQQYYNNNSEAPYCHIVIDSKLHALQQAFAERLRPDSL